MSDGKISVFEDGYVLYEDMEERQKPSRKKYVDYLYIETDEAHIHRQDKSESDGCIMGKLIYVFEGKEEIGEGKRILISPHYFGGLYAGSNPNRMLWESIQRYIVKSLEEEFLPLLTHMARMPLPLERIQL